MAHQHACILSPPAFLLQGVALGALAMLGTLLSPKYPMARQSEQKPRSRRQQMEYRWLERWNEFTS